MAIELITRHMYQGMGLRLSLQNYDDTGGVLPFSIRGFTTGSIADRAAAASLFAKEQLEADFPTLLDVPLDSITGRMVTDGLFIGKAVYRRIPGITVPRRPAFDVVDEFADGVTSSVKYTGVGPVKFEWDSRQPNSSARVLIDGFEKIIWTYQTHPLRSILVRTVLPVHPDSLYTGLAPGIAINSTPVKIGGVVRPAGTLKYVGTDTAGIDSIDNVTWATTHKFQYTPGGWFKGQGYMVFSPIPCSYFTVRGYKPPNCMRQGAGGFNPSISTPPGATGWAGVYVIYDVNLTGPTIIPGYGTVLTSSMYAVDFNNIFPVHEGTGP